MRSRSVFGILLIALLVNGCASQARQGGWITLFDGSTFEGWNRTGGSNWHLADGAAIADKGNKAPSYLVSRESYADFELRVEFWVDAEANSGVFLRCSDPAKVGVATAYEVQIADGRTDGNGTAAITDLAKVSPPRRAAGRWNTFEITARGPQLTVMHDGVVTAQARNDKYARGPIALQHVAGIVKFRRVEIRPL
jgi:hypothetical protein